MGARRSAQDQADGDGIATFARAAACREPPPLFDSARNSFRIPFGQRAGMFDAPPQIAVSVFPGARPARPSSFLQSRPRFLQSRPRNSPLHSFALGCVLTRRSDLAEIFPCVSASDAPINDPSARTTGLTDRVLEVCTTAHRGQIVTAFGSSTNFTPTFYFVAVRYCL
jgi:hypothetical protein